MCAPVKHPCTVCTPPWLTQKPTQPFARPAGTALSFIYTLHILNHKVLRKAFFLPPQPTLLPQSPSLHLSPALSCSCFSKKGGWIFLFQSCSAGGDLHVVPSASYHQQTQVPCPFLALLLVPTCHARGSCRRGGNKARVVMPGSHAQVPSVLWKHLNIVKFEGDRHMKAEFCPDGSLTPRFGWGKLETLTV